MYEQDKISSQGLTLSGEETYTEVSARREPDMGVIYVPELSMKTPVVTKLASGKAQVTFTWTASHVSRVQLWYGAPGEVWDGSGPGPIGELIYSGTESSFTMTLDDGEYEYLWHADGEAANQGTSWGHAPLVIDTTAPTLPSALKVKLPTSANSDVVTFSWTGGQDASSFYYEFTLKKAGSGGTGETTRVSSSTSIARYVDRNVLYEWAVRAVDSHGNATEWVKSTFSTDVTPPGKPAKLKASVSSNRKQVAFSWKAVKDTGRVTYEIAYRKTGTSAYTYRRGISSAKYTLKLSQQSMYDWRVRAVDASGNASAWVKGRAFSNDKTAPKVSLRTPTQKKVRTGRTKVTFSWSSNEKSTYVVKVGSKRIYKGSGTSRSYTLKDGKYTCYITATDLSGNRRTVKKSFRVDATAPKKLTRLKARVSGNGARATLSWKAVKDISGVTYQLAYRVRGTTTYSYLNGLSRNRCTLNLSQAANYEWQVRAVDGRNNASAWVKGRAFKTTAAAASNLDRELALSAGALNVPAASAAATSSPVACSLSLENTESLEKKMAALVALS